MDNSSIDKTYAMLTYPPPPTNATFKQLLAFLYTLPECVCKSVATTIARENIVTDSFADMIIISYYQARQKECIDLIYTHLMDYIQFLPKSND